MAINTHTHAHILTLYYVGIRIFCNEYKTTETLNEKKHLRDLIDAQRFILLLRGTNAPKQREDGPLETIKRTKQNMASPILFQLFDPLIDNNVFTC